MEQSAVKAALIEGQLIIYSSYISFNVGQGMYHPVGTHWDQSSRDEHPSWCILAPMGSRQGGWVW